MDVKVDSRLSKKVALVTGAGRGIGRSIAIGLAGQGAAVSLVARTQNEIESVADEIRARGGKAIFNCADVSAEDEAKDAVATTEKLLGPIDILINNAGQNILGLLHEMPTEVWWKQIEVNLGGAYFFSKAVIPSMSQRGWGRIVNIASAQAKKGEKFVTAYCSAKHGVIGFTRALALEVADKGITVNAICPGFVDTKLTESTMLQRGLFMGLKTPDEIQQFKNKAVKELFPQKSIMKADEVVPSVLFLVSEESFRTTGEALNVSGGFIMH